MRPRRMAVCLNMTESFPTCERGERSVPGDDVEGVVRLGVEEWGGWRARITHTGGVELVDEPGFHFVNNDMDGVIVHGGDRGDRALLGLDFGRAVVGVVEVGVA